MVATEPTRPAGPGAARRAIAVAVELFLSSLDKPWSKPRVQRLFREQAVELSGTASSLLFMQPALRAELVGSGITARGRLLGKAPYTVEINLPIERLRLFGAQGRPLIDDRARVSAQLSEVFPNHGDSRRRRAQTKLSVEIGASQAEVTANKSADGLTLDSNIAANSLALVRDFVSTGGVRIPWEQIGLSLRSKGRIDHLWSTARRGLGTAPRSWRSGTLDA